MMGSKTLTGGEKSFKSPSEDLEDTESSKAFKESYNKWQEEQEEKNKTLLYRIKKFFKRRN